MAHNLPYRQRYRRRKKVGAVGGDVLVPGASWVPGGGLPTGISADVLTRSSSAVEIDSSEYLVTRGVDVRRDNHYIGGVRTALREVQRTNSWLNSNTFTSGWTMTRMTAAGSAATGPDNVASSASSFLETAVTNTHRGTRTLFGGAVVPQNTRLAISFRIKGVGRTYVDIRIRGSLNWDTVFNLSGAGSVHSQSDTTAHPFAKIRTLGNGFYEIAIVHVAQVAVAEALFCDLYGSSTGAVIESYAGDITKGYHIYGAQEEDITGTGSWNICHSSYIATAGSAVTRAADVWYWQMATVPVPAAFTAYTKSITQSAGQNTNGSSHVLFGVTATPAAPYAQMLRWSDAAAQSAMALYNSSYLSSILTTPTAVYGDTAEQVGWINTDGSPQISLTLNGGATNTSTAGTTQAFPGSWQGDRIYLGCDPTNAFAGVIAGFTKIAFKDAVQSLATMQAL